MNRNCKITNHQLPNYTYMYQITVPIFIKINHQMLIHFKIVKVIKIIFFNLLIDILSYLEGQII
jgi:hypothetical protein